MRQQCYHETLHQYVEKLTCQDCQSLNCQAIHMEVAPWEEVTIDLIGLWEVKVNGHTVEFNTLTYLTLIQIQLNLSGLMKRLRQMFMTSSPSVGVATVPDQCLVYMARDALQAVLSNHHWKCLSSRMIALIAKTLHLKQYVKE